MGQREKTACVPLRARREGLRKIAAFRDDKGRIHPVSAACHVGRHLHWNS
jgi:hypothetical protein